jgi:hypothetical protein
MCYETTAHYRNGRLLSNVKDTHALTTVPPAHPSHAALGWRSTASPDYTRKNLLQICEQVVTRLLSSRYQEVFRTECSRLLCTRLITAVTDLLTTIVLGYIQINRQYQICWDSFLRVCWPHRPCHKMKTTCSNTKTSCWRRHSLLIPIRRHLVDGDIACSSTKTSCCYSG